MSDLKVSVHTANPQTDPNANHSASGICNAGTNQCAFPVWDIAFEDIGTVTLCRVHLEQLLDELLIIKKHQINHAEVILGYDQNRKT